MISRRLDREDFLWALDNSRRRYRVRPTRRNDLSAYPIQDPAGFITVVMVRGGAPVVMKDTCGISPGPWFDTDAYADFRLLAINRARALRQQGGAA
ncbi:hypothetical protein [Methylobacterium dankookense]|uniref:Uncharacterized protein n=1 Tax=Methylobacterium dankookense TaxID=560405 RepID=A0A564G3K7_9HYPH|nr:hypothetical protein [Methylobacterium dankookense]GJD58847.1 hypothetical protein IFDJLNFL_4773 [Methylobacterium dankookense]VUF14181.1 hypothetical protein MTDSW087_03897 [Methylobacterium dankookense]